MVRVTVGNPAARRVRRAAVSGAMPSAGIPSPLWRPDEPATTWPASGPAIRQPTAPWARAMSYLRRRWMVPAANISSWRTSTTRPLRSEEHTSELQSLAYLVCRLLLEKKKKKQKYLITSQKETTKLNH